MDYSDIEIVNACIGLIISPHDNAILLMGSVFQCFLPICAYLAISVLLIFTMWNAAACLIACSFMSIFFGLLIFSVVYCDEFRSMAFIAVLGRGMDRLKLVLAKMLDTVILTAFLFLLLGIAGGVTSILMGAQMDAYEMGLFVYSLCRDAAETLISVSLASVFIYVTEKIPVSIVVLMILKLVSMLVDMLSGSARDIVEKLYFMEILRNAWTELVLGAVGRSILTTILCVICYLAVCVTAIHLTFGKKELSF